MSQLASFDAPRRTAAATRQDQSALARALVSPARFNTLSRVAAIAFLLLATVPVAVVRNIPGGWLVDFPQYYMGGTVALHGRWDALYPIANPNSLYNPGDKNESHMRPEYARLAAQRGVPDSHRFIQMPPVAIMLTPMALLPYPTAAAVWVGLCALCAGALAWLGGSFYRMLCGGEESYMQGFVTMAIALLPGTRRAINPGNISPIVALMLALSIRSLLLGEARRFAVWAVCGGALKYVSLVFIPILIAMHRWRTILWLCIVASVMTLATAALVGIEPFREFVRILLLTNRPWLGTDSHNQAVWSLVFQFVPYNPLPAVSVVLITSVRWLTLTLVMVLSFHRPRIDWQRDTATILAACAALVAWLLVFSPIFWIHYVLYLTPLIGWLAWEAVSCRGWVTRAAALLAIFFIAAPYTNGTGVLSIERLPMAFHGLWAAVLILAIATRRLAVKAVAAQVGEDDMQITSASARTLTQRRRLRPAA